ncbi:MAG: CheR family methyltransferase [Kofleriaceae bacterium]
MTARGSHDPELSDELLHSLAGYASRLTGFRPDAIPTAPLRAIAQRSFAEGRSSALLSQLAELGHAQLGRELTQAVPIGETYFFRHPEQFELLARLIVPYAAAPGRIRCWSAGCATGEEAYSLAACVRAAAPRDTEIEILGTDIVEASLATARRGEYKRWSTRSSGPLLYRLLAEAPGNQVRVVDDLRRVVEFELHNLLEPPRRDNFDIILCRNVLVYFKPQAAAEVCARLVSALGPDGVIVFGSMDLQEIPPGLMQFGPSDLNAFMRGDSRPQLARPRARPPQERPQWTPPRPRSAPEPVSEPIDPVALHTSALSYIEVGDPTAAEDLLEQVTRRAPDYVPGLIERALLHKRYDRVQRADELMREALRKLDALPVTHMLPGPHPMAAGDYRRLVRAYLDQRGRR